ncbi:MlaD family protein [Gordonia terrae]
MTSRGLLRYPHLLSAVAMLVVVLSALVYMNSLGLSVTDNRNVRTVSMSLPNTNGLVPGSRVLLRGVPIGHVTEVKPSIEGVEVVWNYKDRYSIPADSSVRVDNLSALGETFVGVTPSANEQSLDDGAVLAASTVTVPTTVDELSARLVSLLRQVNTDDLNTVVDELNRGLVIDRDVLTDFVRFGVLLETTLMSTRVPFTDLLRNLQPLFADGAGISDSMDASVAPLNLFGRTFSQLLTAFSEMTIEVDHPRGLNEYTGPFLQHILDFLQDTGPDLKTIGDAAHPYVVPALAKLKTADVSQLMQTALAMTGNGDGIEIRVGGGR